jgi:hypothetical protein
MSRGYYGYNQEIERKQKAMSRLVERSPEYRASFYDPNNYFIYVKVDEHGKKYIKKIYLTGSRKLAKKLTNRKVRHMDSVPNHAGYRKTIPYDYILF